MTAETERIEALEAALARITGERERQQAAEAAKQDWLEGKTQPELTGHAADVLKVQALKRQARVKAHEEQQRRYEEQLVANAPRRAKLMAQLEEIRKQQQAEADRHASASAKLGGEYRKVELQINQLDRPPEMPEPDLRAAQALARELAPQPFGLPPVPARRPRVNAMGF